MARTYARIGTMPQCGSEGWPAALECAAKAPPGDLTAVRQTTRPCHSMRVTAPRRITPPASAALHRKQQPPGFVSFEH